jgi:undecaprenyl pyrophosphate synthase
MKNQLTYTIWGLYYDWHAWAWWAKFMIERDTIGMKLPRHVAVILDQRKLVREYDADESVRRAAELATWCACAGISILTIYEPTGIIFCE